MDRMWTEKCWRKVAAWLHVGVCLQVWQARVLSEVQGTPGSTRRSTGVRVTGEYICLYPRSLAGRSFRTLIAIAARFNLELIQFDAINPFVNAELNKEIYMRMPQDIGSLEPYSDCSRELSRTLSQLGFRPVPHEPVASLETGYLCSFMWMISSLPTGKSVKDLPTLQSANWRWSTNWQEETNSNGF